MELTFCATFPTTVGKFLTKATWWKRGLICLPFERIQFILVRKAQHPGIGQLVTWHLPLESRGKWMLLLLN